CPWVLTVSRAMTDVAVPSGGLTGPSVPALQLSAVIGLLPRAASEALTLRFAAVWLNQPFWPVGAPVTVTAGGTPSELKVMVTRPLPAARRSGKRCPSVRRRCHRRRLRHPPGVGRRKRLRAHPPRPHPGCHPRNHRTSHPGPRPSGC